MILSEKSTQIQSMFDKISKRYDFLNRLLSAGQDTRWRNKMISSFPKIHTKKGVLYDIACGTGDVLLNAKSKRKDYATFVGFDISEGMLTQAKLRAQAKYSDVQFVQASAEKIPAANHSADCVTISFGLRNVDNREQALREFHRILKTGGTLFVLEFFQSENTLIAKLFDFYFKNILPKIGGFISDRAAYEYLPKSVSTMPKGDEFKKILSEIGFVEIEQTNWLAGATRLFKAVKKS
ncbi:bifunctional demethylmenaquinone methyltransferase/2-methoxy-6-polyprenyl-1,4-benzoquinol methylase [Silvanigrella aquatica]|uniref:Demethylmenaquinone methyltransferase n=2 Tax=Silvanigrella aquatica TaxID=1915309 RepID=A0A1L4D4F2_9BACT|nr:bifunctional demethylmenaquinone methyltransferase/2-methoxy-6-polyprenyl-1,4-benzoquinol methylase [Silvanigrella aquatica]